MDHAGPKTEAADAIHAMKYRGEGEDFREAINRIAFALKDNDKHYHELREILLDQRFCPAGRIQSAMGSMKVTTPWNCFVSGVIADSFVDGQGSIMDRAKEAAATMRQGGGIGYDFSTLRPRGELIKKIGSHATGPVSFMGIYNAVCLATSSSGHRRGAQMGVLRVDHPDITEFIKAKQNEGHLTGFNISIGITDEFMEAALAEKPFDLRWGGRVYRTIDAAELWESIMRSTWDWAEPGVLFLDAINRQNNLHYCETITATNPCFTGDTEVWTAFGPAKFRDLAEAGQPVKVLTQLDDGTCTFKIMENPRKTQEDAYLVEVTFATIGAPSKIRCTPDHEFYQAMQVRTNPPRPGQAWGPGKKIKAKDIQPGNTILFASHPNRQNMTTSPIKVISVVELPEREDVYCGTVPENARFFVQFPGRPEGVLVSNCGEQPLPPFGACLLGSFNLVKYLNKVPLQIATAGPRDPGVVISGGWTFDYLKLHHDIPIVVRAMDNIIDRGRYPLAEQRAEGINKRRMGIGVMGLANTAEALGFPYGSAEFLEFEGKVLPELTLGCYRASAALAKEKGVFPLFDAERFLKSGFMMGLPEDIREMVRVHGLRNSHLTSIAPTGTISMAADNVSSGIEPVFSYGMDRPVNTPNGPKILRVEDYGAAFLDVRGKLASQVTAEEHVDVLTTAQIYVDSAVSKTCNVDGDKMEWADFKNIYKRAWEGGAKGCTTFNSAGKKGALLVAEDEGANCRIDADTGRRECE